MSWFNLIVMAVLAFIGWAVALREFISRFIAPLEAQIRQEAYVYLTNLPDPATFAHADALEIANALAQVPGLLLSFVIIVVLYSAAMFVLNN